MRWVALALLAIALAYGQSTTPFYTYYFVTCAVNAADVKCAYQFRPARTVMVKELWFIASAYTAGPHNVQLSIQSDSSGAPSGTPLGTVNTVVNAAPAYFGGTLNIPITLTGATPYWFVVQFASYTSGGFSIGSGYNPYEFTSLEEVNILRYANSAWEAVINAGPPFILVNTRGEIIMQPTPVIQVLNNTLTVPTTVRCQFPFAGTVRGIVEAYNVNSSTGRQYTIAVHGQTKAQVTVPAAGVSGYFGTIYVDLLEPFRIGKFEPVDITISPISANYAIATLQTAGLPQRLIDQLRGYCRGSNGHAYGLLGLVIDKFEPLSGGFVTEQ